MMQECKVHKVNSHFLAGEMQQMQTERLLLLIYAILKYIILCDFLRYCWTRSIIFM